MDDCGQQCKIPNFRGDSQITLPTFQKFMTSYITDTPDGQNDFDVMLDSQLASEQ